MGFTSVLLKVHCRILKNSLLVSVLIKINLLLFSHLVACLTTGPKPLPLASSPRVFGKRLSRKGNNVVVFPFAFHIAVQQPFKPLWSRLLLYDLEPSQASFALRFKSLLMTLLPASEEFLSKFPSSRYLSSSDSYPLDLSGVGDPAGSKATSGLALRVTGTLKPLHHNKVEIPSGDTCNYRGKLQTIPGTGANAA